MPTIIYGRDRTERKQKAGAETRRSGKRRYAEWEKLGIAGAGGLDFEGEVGVGEGPRRTRKRKKDQQLGELGKGFHNGGSGLKRPTSEGGRQREESQMRSKGKVKEKLREDRETLISRGLSNGQRKNTT